jgi:hypothetical protein
MARGGSPGRRAENDPPGSGRTKHQLQGMLARNGVVFVEGGVLRRLIPPP